MPPFLFDLLARGLLDARPAWLLVHLLVVTQLTVLTVTLYLHRSQTHRAVMFHPVLAHGFRFWAWLTTAMVTREWVAVHRKHHARCETEQDPHSPHVLGLGKLLREGAELYIEARADPSLVDRYGRGTPDDWIERHVYAPHSNWGPTLLAVVNIALFGVAGMAIWAVQMMWIPFWGAGVVNGMGHRSGYRNFETPDCSTNLVPWGVWVGGEELHNNHHAYPGSARFSSRPWEFDVGWLVIRVLATLELADVRCVAVPLPRDASGAARSAKPALLAPAVAIMTRFVHEVARPVVRDHVRGPGPASRLPRNLQRALLDGGRWLGVGDRIRFDAWIDTRPRLRSLLESRALLADAMHRRDRGEGSACLASWMRAAESSQLEALRSFAASMRPPGTGRPGMVIPESSGCVDALRLFSPHG